MAGFAGRSRSVCASAGEDLGRSPKVLMRMFSAKGNPQAKNLFEIVAHLQKVEGTKLKALERAA